MNHLQFESSYRSIYAIDKYKCFVLSPQVVKQMRIHFLRTTFVVSTHSPSLWAMVGSNEFPLSRGMVITTTHAGAIQVLKRYSEL